MKTPDTVTASEIGVIVYRAEAWGLAAFGTCPTPTIQVARSKGERHHARFTVAETAATRAIRRGRGLITIGVALFVSGALWALLQ